MSTDIKYFTIFIGSWLSGTVMITILALILTGLTGCTSPAIVTDIMLEDALTLCAANGGIKKIEHGTAILTADGGSEFINQSATVYCKNGAIFNQHIKTVVSKDGTTKSTKY